jgi:phosphoribosylformylglycinamidine cyclo-ligase
VTGRHTGAGDGGVGEPAGATYAAAGVDVEAGERAVALMRTAIARAQRPEVVGGVGGFAGLFDASALTRFRRPLLATSTDGVGTKIDVARRMDVHDTIGIDLVAMVVDDLVVCGAEPLFMTDYIAVGSVVPERVAAIVTGIAEGCRQAGAALVGGETAEHPGLLEPDEYDVAGAGTGVVEADALLGPDRVREGDVLIAMGSSGLHSNGYSLARHVLFDRAGWSLERHVPELGRTLGEELLEPTRIYALDVLDLMAGAGVHAVSHITGGGIAANVARVLPVGMHAEIDRPTWTPPAIFELIGELGGVSLGERERTFNEGLGMVAVVDPAHVSDGIRRLAARGVAAWVCGHVRTARPGDASDAAAKGGTGGTVRLVGAHP